MKANTEKAVAYGALALAALLIYSARKNATLAAPGQLASAAATSSNYWQAGTSALDAAVKNGAGAINLSGWGVLGYSDPGSLSTAGTGSFAP